MLNNILLTYLYENENNINLHPIYQEMVNVCIKSFRKNLAGNFETRIIDCGKVSYDVAMRLVFDEADEIYHYLPRNVLLIDGDILCAKPVEIFNQFKEYRIWGTQSGEIPDGLPRLGIEYQINSGLRYFPAGLPENIWELGRDLSYDWKNIWAYDQYIYDAMFYAQNIVDYRDYLDPRYCYMVPGQEAVNNGVHESDAFILHYHSSRDPLGTLEKMRQRAI